MPEVKKIVVAGVLVLGVLAVIFLQTPAAGPASPAPRGAMIPARADLAEAVFAMVLENAASQGLALSQPVTLCEACVAAHLGLPGEGVRERCERACGLR
ncbi:hypothetical protein [Desulfovibrio sp. TomC]|uniref:hypothetical protein n=1 Tax=Desulfovibrio sp. TomC TaxID=1562888 RepID=UPI0005733D94|nr:hypothetical protein [Desulfovibrio sp. TomC]KHK02996.1 hypothetical protein NY78_1525 [Desulfovibrio sp. TomC]